MGNIFFEITIIICLVSVFTIILKLLRQPVILAYILTGIIIGPFGQLQFQNIDAIKTMGEFGITLLLFMMGLELNLRELKSIGKAVFIIGINQIVLTGLAAYFISSILSFPVLTSFYISIALTLSSTIIVVKLLSDKRELTSLYGKISIGLLLVQDFLAILVLIFLSGFNSESQSLSLSQSNFFSIFKIGRAH
ncbi:cation:proton antiporter, partial [Patescibacteria group bacterium]|nr:cation:proton antiporter [Patescibacteria group bacterium]